MRSLRVFLLFVFQGLIASFAIAAAPPATRISLERARNIALAAIPGKIRSEELEFENSKWIYSFDIKGKDAYAIREIHVDALTGKIIRMERETKAQESAEEEEPRIQ